jgi:hypothetical protein
MAIHAPTGAMARDRPRKNWEVHVNLFVYE